MYLIRSHRIASYRFILFYNTVLGLKWYGDLNIWMPARMLFSIGMLGHLHIVWIHFWRKCMVSKQIKSLYFTLNKYCMIISYEPFSNKHRHQNESFVFSNIIMIHPSLFNLALHQLGPTNSPLTSQFGSMFFFSVDSAPNTPNRLLMSGRFGS